MRTRDAGFFGKVPMAADFVTRGLPARTAERWAAHVSGWLATARARNDWLERYESSPSLRIFMPCGAIDERSWAGAMMSSFDSVSRAFPLSVLIEVEAEATPSLERAERAMSAFARGACNALELLERLQHLACDPSAGESREGSDALADALKADDALDGIVRIGSSEDAWTLTLAGTGGAGEREFCRWWRAAQHCVTRGMPTAAAGAALLVGEWESFGWTGCMPVPAA